MWFISIDTGGTFTDCIAVGPTSETKRIKVLSSSCLRGQYTGRVHERCISFSHHWGIDQDIFQDYFLQWTGQDQSLYRVREIDFVHNRIFLHDPLPDPPEGFLTFDLTAHEEAPVLAARIATATPLNRPLPPVQIRLGTTRGTNALLERKGARTLLLLTHGFKDLLYIGNQQRPDLFQLHIPEPGLLYEDVLEVQERLDVSGKVIKPLTRSHLRKIVAAVRQKNAESVAIVLMHAWKNPVHEQALKSALESAGIRFISLSHELMPAIKIVPRAQTAVVNAYLKPILDTYINRILAKLPGPDPSLRIMNSAGGLNGWEHFEPKDSLLSGPAGGVVGAAMIARRLGFDKTLTLDMGGTSTDTSRFEGHFDYEYMTRTGGVDLLSPSLSIETVAAGGGSICGFDGQRLYVGPDSAGASPGPACYGAGGPLAITDVNLLLGKLDPESMGIPVNREKARQALLDLQAEILQKTGRLYPESELLSGFEQIANEKMAGAIRKISVARGFDPQAYALVAFGGAGGLHACKVARLLDIRTIILPCDAGLLSAYGISQARVERFAHRQVLERLDEVAARLPDILDALGKDATRQLQMEGFGKRDISLPHQLCYLRLEGQDSSLEIEYTDPQSLPVLFENAYRRLFGHFPGNRAIVLESVKVIAAGQQATDPSQYPGRWEEPAPGPYPSPNGPVQWESLREGDVLAGPFVLIQPHCTAYIEPDWVVSTGPQKNLVLVYRGAAEKPEMENRSAAVNPAQLELFANRFSAIAEEMGAQLQRTAFSVNIKERLDFSCALLDARAELLVNAPHIPVHLGSLGICARLVRDKIPLGPGDVAIVNHPKYGGSHLPDVTLLSPVYDMTSKKGPYPLIGYVINRAHHAEIGGMRPGSMPPDATCLEEEGVVILPTWMVRSGVVQWEAIEELLTGSPYPTRALHENLADLNAALASLKAGERKLQELVSAFGLGQVHQYMDALKRSAAETLEGALRPWAGHRFTATEKMDDGRPLSVQVTLENPGIVIDFSGTGPVHPHNLNANLSIVYSAVIYVLRLIAGKEVPLNEGLMKNVDIKLPPGTFLHPDFSDHPARCPAVVGGNTEVSQRLVDTLLKAFAPILKTACSQGTMNNFLFGNARFGYYETLCGGTGAGENHPGRSAVHQHMTNTRITDPEELEFRFPVRLHRFGIRKYSGGTGKWKGGDGVIREFEFLEEVDMTLISQHRKEAPYGLEGGGNGKRGRQFLVRCGHGKKEKMAGIDSRRVRPGDRVLLETPGGGGYGSEDL